MIMTTNLDRSVASVGDSKRDGLSILVQDNLARSWKNLARYHVNPSLSSRIINSSANRIVNADELGTIRESSFDLHLVKHFRNSFHDLISAQDLSATGHELRNRLPVACSFHDKIGYKRNTLGIVKLDASGESSPRDQRRERDHKLVFFTRHEIHE